MIPGPSTGNSPADALSETPPCPPCSGTYQAYLRRLPAHLDHAIRHAQDNGYILGVKLVRGAYHLQETKKWKDEGRGKFGKDPIWDE